LLNFVTLCPHCNFEFRVFIDDGAGDKTCIWNWCPNCGKRVEIWIRFPTERELAEIPVGIGFQEARLKKLPSTWTDKRGERLIEGLAVLEHRQFAHWIKYQLENMHILNWKRWTEQAETPYAMLSEKEKESDREWALKVLQVLVKHGVKIE